MIDGTIEPAEWEGAAVTVMDDGTELKWLHTGGFLYVGILNDTIGAANLAVTGEDYVRILHSSAALGSASYQRQADGTWHLEHGFEWCCRNPADPNDGDLLLADEGWLANIGFVGAPGHIEYQLMLAAGELRVAISYAYTIDSVAFWPADLPTADRESLYGYREDQETFTVETWMLVVPAD